MFRPSDLILSKAWWQLMTIYRLIASHQCLTRGKEAHLNYAGWKYLSYKWRSPAYVAGTGSAADLEEGQWTRDPCLRFYLRDHRTDQTLWRSDCRSTYATKGALSCCVWSQKDYLSRKRLRCLVGSLTADRSDQDIRYHTSGLHCSLHVRSILCTWRLCREHT